MQLQLPPIVDLVAKNSTRQSFHDEKVSQIGVVVRVVLNVNSAVAIVIAVVSAKAALLLDPVPAIAIVNPVQPDNVEMGSNVLQQERLVDQIGRGRHESPHVSLPNGLLAQ